MILLALVALVVVVSLRGLPATLSGDGLGHRPGPRSHAVDEFEPRAEAHAAQRQR